MKIRIYRQTEQDFDRIEIEGATFETIVSRAAVEGLQCSGYDSNPSQRPELQGAPKFKGVCGPKIGRASCRERVCQYVEIAVVAVSLKKKDCNDSIWITSRNKSIYKQKIK